MSPSIRFSDGGWHGGAKRPLRGQSLKDVKSLRMVQNHPPQTDDDDDGKVTYQINLGLKKAERVFHTLLFLLSTLHN